MIGAITLDDCLRRSTGSLGPNFAKDFFTRLDNKTEGAWYVWRLSARGHKTEREHRSGTKYMDYFVPTTEVAQDETRESGAGMRWYMAQLDELERLDVRATNPDKDDQANEPDVYQVRDVVWRKFQMMQWLAPPTVLFAPQVIARVMWHVLSKKIFA